ncbi:beta-galactosidase [Nitzschia inconspicua]|uniref:Beta-galactosidase n=1 Tax=Nitzschia inconspicua TaxID=303405 RepID=A0A9K3KYW7_9STRA|nr:beta-galactosidase [Nitzschia inconspicua]
MATVPIPKKRCSKRCYNQRWSSLSWKASVLFLVHLLVFGQGQRNNAGAARFVRDGVAKLHAFSEPNRPPPPYWPKYSGKRHVYILDGLWNTSQLPADTPFDSMNPELDPSTIATPNLTVVPSTIDNAPPGYLGFRGVSWFRTTFQTTTTTTNTMAARLQFQACSFYCRVWVNGVEMGDHKAGGYVAWWLDVSSEVLYPVHQQSTITVELTVLVDNRWNVTTAPMHTGGDFWHYGGILRSVEWHELPAGGELQETQQKTELWPWRLYIFPQKDLKSVHLKLQLVQRHYTGPVEDIVVAFNPDEPDRMSRLILFGYAHPGENGMVDLGIVQVPSPRIWSTHDPQLHEVSVDLNGATVTERFGLRHWDTAPSSGGNASRIQLNGQVIKLVGWNHHTQWPYTAASPTDDQLDADLALLQETGHVNFVRGAHYPQDPRWLDRLDEAGIIMWCETLGPDTTVKNMQDVYFLKFQNQQINEMLDNAMNHASIAFWAFFNEGPSDKEDACPGYQASSDAIQARDDTRFITYASNKSPVPDKCSNAATVLSRNGYPGWYQTSDPSEYWNAIASAAALTTKPFIISETGAGGIYEWTHNTTATMWTLDYQTQVISQDVDNAIANPNISGICLWHFFDFKVDDKWENNTHCDYLPDVEPPLCGYIDVDTSRALGRPGGLNHKGVVDFYRRPKPVFSIVAAKYQEVTDSKKRNGSENMDASLLAR